MKKVFYIVVIPLLLIINTAAIAQTNKGTEFWTAFLSHNLGVDDPDNRAMMTLYITSDISTTGSVEIGGALLQNFTVTANQVTFVDIPASAFLKDAGTYTGGGIHITSQYPIAVYAHIYAHNVSGATLLLPVNAMGKEYTSLNYTQVDNNTKTPAYSSFAVIGTENNTTVSITPTADLTDHHPANTTFQVTLNKGEVYQSLSSKDLTGTKIESVSNTAGGCKKIAVFSGSTRLGIGCSGDNNDYSSDNLFQQVYPTSTWGKNYIAIPLRSRPYDIYRIVLSDPNTTVTLNGSAINKASFINGLYYEFKSRVENVISADKPIQVVQYSPSENQELDCTVGSNDIGDPEMIYLSPVEQGLSHVTLYATGYYLIVQSYINVVIPTSAVSSFKLDGVSYASSFSQINSTYSFAQIPVSSGPQTGGAAGTVSSGTHTLDASVPFNAIVYGFGDHESYGYAAGTNLADFSENLTVANADDPNAAPITSGCSNITYKAKVTLPFQTTSITWKVDGVNVKADSSPTAITTVKDNKTLYTYEYNTELNFIAGNHVVVATVFNPVADACGSNQDIESYFSISNPPPVTFTAPADDCLGNSTPFKDTTVPAMGQSIKSWHWDFDDNTSSAEQNPVHQYALSGTYNVRLTEIDNNGCTTISAPVPVHIVVKPVANFNMSGSDCAGQTITFTNSSTSAEGTITKWTWDFGDGTPLVDAANGQSQKHTYTNANTYTVKLSVTTAGGCVSEVKSQTLIINPSPVAAFTVPAVCVSEPAHFINGSSIADGTENEFTYLWNFGDAGAPPASNQSTLKNPQHQYSAVGPYNVTLTVTSKYGCTTTVPQTITVNGANPKAAFTVENNCSGDEIVFDDKSTVDAYNITKIIWWFDYANHPEQFETYEGAALHANKKYTHRYPLFNSPAKKSYVIHMEAYSGTTCYDATLFTPIDIYANPVIGLSANNTNINTIATTPDTVSVCYADVPLQIVEDKASYAGAGAFTGQGISTTGLIDPQRAGVGVYTVNYLFTASATGCTYAASFVLKVNPTPVVSLPSRFTVLEGNQLTLRAVANITGGSKLTYKWTPQTGLSADDVAAPVATLSDDIRYTLTVTSDKGCSTSVETFVKVLKIPVIPNTFTPNGDGINDTWEIKYLNDYPNATVEIFNRLGSRVFHSSGYGIPWDGRFNGADLPVGTYYYIISPNSGRKPTSGYLAIIR